MPRVGSTALEEVVPWRWTVGQPPHGRPARQCGDTTSLASDSPLPPPRKCTRQVWNETVLSHGRSIIRVDPSFGLWVPLGL
jgi:hypothetical protein